MKTRVAVVFGGRSTEHEISCVSAGSVLRAIDRDRYDVVAVGITPQGRWVLGPDDPEALSIHGRDLPSVKDGAAVALPGDPTVGGLVALEDVGDLVRRIDVVFPVLHGPYGEDGTVQGLLEMAGVPYVGAGVLSSAVAMDKAVAKVLLVGAGLPVAPYAVVRCGAGVPAGVEALGLPVFVKPARGGSSIGISKVSSLADLEPALQLAFSSDRKVLVEGAMVGREVECGVLDGPNGPQASVPAEVRLVGDHAFYDFEAKYLSAATELCCPADLPAATTAHLQDLARRAYVALECEGLARVDFFVDADGSVTVNEVNTMPGFTPTSMFPRMWAASGVDYPTLVDRLLQNALDRGVGLR